MTAEAAAIGNGSCPIWNSSGEHGDSGRLVGHGSRVRDVLNGSSPPMTGVSVIRDGSHGGRAVSPWIRDGSFSCLERVP